MSRPPIPTIKFDVSRVTETVKADIKKNVMLLEEVDRNNFDQIYDAALRSISAGRDLSLLSSVLMKNGVTKQRAAEIVIFLNNRATALMNRERSVSLGIKRAVWIYSGAPCDNPRSPTDQQKRQNEAHRLQTGSHSISARECFWMANGRGRDLSRDVDVRQSRSCQAFHEVRVQISEVIFARRI
jgi:hypothetical protein